MPTNAGILLDTHIWVWLISGSDELSDKTIKLLDTADRIIIATARIKKYRLITRDEKIVKYGQQGHLVIMKA